MARHLTGRKAQTVGAQLTRKLGREPTSREIIREVNNQVQAVKVSPETKAQLPSAIGGGRKDNPNG
jgi:DNA-directed RNA polymerase specialized sigma subunit